MLIFIGISLFSLLCPWQHLYMELRSDAKFVLEELWFEYVSLILFLMFLFEDLYFIYVTLIYLKNFHRLIILMWCSFQKMERQQKPNTTGGKQYQQLWWCNMVFKYVCYGLSASHYHINLFFNYNRAYWIYYIQIEHSKYIESIMFSFFCFYNESTHYIKCKEVYFKEDLFTKKKQKNTE